MSSGDDPRVLVVARANEFVPCPECVYLLIESRNR